MQGLKSKYLKQNNKLIVKHQTDNVTPGDRT